MRSLVLPVVLTLPLLWLGACGDANKKGGGSNPLATVSGLCQAWAEVACNEDVVGYCVADDADACQSAQAAFCENLVPSEGYDSKNASTCLRAVEDAFADGNLDADELLVVRDLGGDCSTLIRGEAEEGDACSQDSNCDTIAGFICVRRGEGGTCQKPVDVGAGRSCAADSAVCEDGFYCDGRNCVERLPEDSSCTDSSECASDLRCVGAASGAAGAGGNGQTGERTCIPRAGSLDPCEAHDDCESGYCLKLESSAPGECISTIRLARTEPLCEDLR